MYAKLKDNMVTDVTDKECPENVTDLFFFCLEDFEEFQRTCLLNKDKIDID